MINIEEVKATLVYITTLLVLAVYSLFALLGEAFFAGLGVLVVAGIFGVVMASWIAKTNTLQMKATDARMDITTQLLHNIKTVKLSGWEAIMESKINSKRD